MTDLVMDVLRVLSRQVYAVHVLMEFLGDSNNSTAIDVISFVREVVECNSQLRKHILDKLLQGFSELKSGKVLRGALWILGEYCTDLESKLCANAVFLE